MTDTCQLRLKADLRGSKLTSTVAGQHGAGHERRETGKAWDADLGRALRLILAQWTVGACLVSLHAILTAVAQH